MSEAIAWITENWHLIGALVGALLGLASVITALTKSPKDDEVVKKIAGWLSFLTPSNAPGTLKLPGTSVPVEGLEEDRGPFSRLDR